MVKCGEESVSFVELAASVRFVNSCGWMIILTQPSENRRPDFVTSMLDIRQAYKTDGNIHISMTLCFHASDPRDKVFALLGILGPSL